MHDIEASYQRLHRQYAWIVPSRNCFGVQSYWIDACGFALPIERQMLIEA